MSSLDDRLDSVAQAWRPQVGEKLTGVVVAIGERISNYNDKPYVVLTVRTDDGHEFVVHAFHTVLAQELAMQRPQVGDRIGIRYDGQPEGKNYESYRVVVERNAPAPELDWERIAAGVDAELSGNGTTDGEEASAEADEIPF